MLMGALQVFPRMVVAASINMGRNNFWQEFEYGASYEVYCTYERMVLQLKYRSRIFKALHPVIYFIYIYDS